MATIPAQSSAWDERRNTSRVFAVPPGAVNEALRALQTIDPAVRRWIEDGHPLLTEDEHVARFGQPYKTGRGRRR